MHIKNIHFLPNKSAKTGTHKTVVDQPAKNILPKRPILDVSVQIKSSYSTRLCRLVSLL